MNGDTQEIAIAVAIVLTIGFLLWRIEKALTCISELEEASRSLLQESEDADERILRRWDEE